MTVTRSPWRRCTSSAHGLRALSEETFRRRGGRGDNLPGFGAIAGRGRVDIRLAEDNDGELYVLTKGDGMIREVRSVR